METMEIKYKLFCSIVRLTNHNKMDNRDSNEVSETVEELILKAIWQSKFSENFETIKTIRSRLWFDHVYFKWLENDYIHDLKYDEENPFINAPCECIRYRTFIAIANGRVLKKIGIKLKLIN